MYMYMYKALYMYKVLPTEGNTLNERLNHIGITEVVVIRILLRCHCLPSYLESYQYAAQLTMTAITPNSICSTPHYMTITHKSL